MLNFSLRPSEFSHCVAMEGVTGEVTTEDCDRGRFTSLCKVGKSGPFEIHPFPQEITDKGMVNEPDF